MILLPLHDDECTGARVESHDVAVSPASTDVDGTVSNDICIDVVEEAGEVLDESEPLANEKLSSREGDESNIAELGDSEKLGSAAENLEGNGSVNKNASKSNESEHAGIAYVEQQSCGEGASVQVPVGYVLVKITTHNDAESHDVPKELESMDFTDILSFLRGSVFPLSLEFVPPNTTAESDCISSSVDASLNAIENKSTDIDDACAKAETNDNESQQPLSTIVSRDEAAKFAKQAATELRGCLSRWSYQAATLAVDAATQVKELRDDRQRKIKDEHQDRDGENQSEMESEVSAVLCGDAKESGAPDVDEVAANRASAKQMNKGGCCPSCSDSEQVLKADLEKYMATATELAQQIDDMNKSHSHFSAAQEKTMKALNNEKSVLLAAIESRDGKIDGLKKQIAELAKQSSLQSEKLATIESLRNDLVQAQNKYSSAEKVIAEMKSIESELQEELSNAKEHASMLESECRRWKQIASKCESDFKTLKTERNCLKNKADGLSKEIQRMSKNNSDTSEVARLTKLVHELKIKNTNLMDQVEVQRFENKRILETLDATCKAHLQSVRYQISTEASNSAHVPESRVRELESVISSMADHLNAKDQQIETLKEINRALLEDN